MKIFHSHGHVIGGALLIAGTTIGVGMLGLPVATGPGGFFPSMIIYLICWAFMLCTGLLLVEVCSWMPNDSNLISMASRLLGKPGKIICWLVYLFLFETVMIAHMAGGGSIMHEIFAIELSSTASMIVYVLLFSPVVYLGTQMVDRLNIIMFSGVIISYLLFVFIAYKYVNFSFLEYQDWSKAALAFPILFTAFTYQVIIPTLMTYMKRDVKRVRKAVILGTSIPLSVYLIWQILILGIVPVEGANGLIDASSKGQNAVQPLKHFIESKFITGVGHSFAFFAMTTSYIALALAFVDFLADGLHVKKKGLKKVGLCLAIFIPPLIISLIYPDIFLKALSYAGGISCAILFGLYPPLMTRVGRYIKHYKTKQLIPGGKPLLIFLIIFILVELGMEIATHF
ncbi:MAG TPA: aromatic amino acid transport family protein [Rhabdochlamydiaceae bacterium]|nr:aromatic amino acid transport family protein [Rhabdochlamydiaceae bacterium]